MRKKQAVLDLGEPVVCARQSMASNAEGIAKTTPV
jgi:hypothetical protein